MPEGDCIGGSNVLQTMAISDIEEVGHCSVGSIIGGLVVGRRQHSESIEVALEWSKEV